jgi:hypothetical protein
MDGFVVAMEVPSQTTVAFTVAVEVRVDVLARHLLPAMPGRVPADSEEKYAPMLPVPGGAAGHVMSHWALLELSLSTALITGVPPCEALLTCDIVPPPAALPKFVVIVSLA